MKYHILSCCTHAQGDITLPGSKSISNRVLLLSALSRGKTLIHNLLDADDITHMKTALSQLGVQITQKNQHDYLVESTGHYFPSRQAQLFLGNAGTAFRPLTAVLALNEGTYELSGIPRMHERPIQDLVDALTQIGASIDYLEKPAYPPLRIRPAQPNTTQIIQVRGNVSSQFLTALLMALPMRTQSTTIEVIGTLISRPYIAITLNLLKKFGIEISHDQSWQKFIIPAVSHYQSPHDIYVEGDASSASYFLAAGAIAGKVTVHGIGKHSIQGDVAFADALTQMGAVITYEDHAISAQKPDTGLRGITIDCLNIPDAAMTLAIVAVFAKGTTRLNNIASWRVKETDRIHAMATELTKLGITVTSGADFIEITPPPTLQAIHSDVKIATYDDHRMAMCFSLISFAQNIIIMDPECVNKTYPQYFEDFKKIQSACID